MIKTKIKKIKKIIRLTFKTKMIKNIFKMTIN